MFQLKRNEVKKHTFKAEPLFWCKNLGIVFHSRFSWAPEGSGWWPLSVGDKVVPKCEFLASQLADVNPLAGGSDHV